MLPLVHCGKLWPPLIGMLLPIITVCLAVYYLLYVRQIQQWKQSNIPFLRPTFLLGHRHFLNLTKHSLVVPLDKIYRENSDKKLLGFFIGTLPVILIRNPKLVHQVLVKNFNKTFGTGFEVAEFEEEAQCLLQTTSNWVKWKFGRAIMSPIFSPARVANSRFDRINEEINKMQNFVEKITMDGDPVNLTQLSKNFVFNSSVCPNFGINSDSDDNARSLRDMLDKFFEPSLCRLLRVFLRMQLPAFFQVFEPLKFVPSYMRNTMTKILNEHAEFKGQLSVEKYDFIDYLRSLKVENELQNEKFGTDPSQNYKGLNFRQMVGYCVLVPLASSETVILLAQFTIHLLSLQPKYQKQIREEVIEVMEKHKTSKLNFEVVQDFHFTLRCLYEAARLYHFVPFIMRQCSEDFQIPGTEYILRKKDKVMIAPYSLQRDSKYFHNPLQFDPNRFTFKNGEIVFPEAYWSFGAGPRKCLGYKQGLIVAAAFVASLLQRNDVKPHSHKKQMDATDYHPRSVANISKSDIFVNVVPCDGATEQR